SVTSSIFSGSGGIRFFPMGTPLNPPCESDKARITAFAVETSSRRDKTLPRRHCTRVLLGRPPFWRQRAQGMPVRTIAPAALRAKGRKHASKSPQARRTIRHSLHNGVTAYPVLSPVNRALLPPSPRVKPGG